MKHSLIFLFLTLSFSTTQAQFHSNSYAISRSDLETNEYKADSTANALVIYEYGNSYIDNKSFKLITQIKRKIKIFNNKGYDNSNVEVFLYEGKKARERINGIRGTTYNLIDDKVVINKLDNANIYTEDYNDEYKVIKFTLPNIQDGCVITYSYTTTSPYIYKYHGWKFQEAIPKLYSEYNTSIPANYDYYIKLVGSLKLDENSKKLKRKCIEVGFGAFADCTLAKYVMTDIPAFVEEDYMTAKKNYISRIEYELNTINRFDGTVEKISKTWKDVDKEIRSMPSIGKQLNRNTKLNGLIASKYPKSNDQLTNAKNIYQFVQEHFTWNNEYRFFKEVDVKKLETNRSGNATEINILLHNVLKEQGFDVKPILISTRKNGFPTKLYPVISEFNYLIVKLNLDGEPYLLDATDKYLSFGQLPFRCLNEYGRLMDFKKGSSWIDIKADKLSIQQHQVILDLNEDSQFEGTLNSRYSDYHALSKKKSYYPNPTEYLENFKDEQVNIEILEHKF